MNRTVGTLQVMASRLGVGKSSSHEYARLSRIGRKGDHRTRCLPIGHLRIRCGYQERKIANTGLLADDWISEHRRLWEENNGPVPDGDVVFFKDGDPMNCEPENLNLATHADLLKRGREQWIKLPLCVRQAISAARKLERTIRGIEDEK